MYASGRQVLIGLLGAALMFLVQDAASARTPLAYFKGVERFALFCGRPTDADLRDRLCDAARGVLERLTGTPVVVGPKGLGDPSTMTVLVNGHEVDGPQGPVFAVTLDLYRRGHVDGRLIGAAPLLLAEPRAVTNSEDFKDSLGKALAELVVDPWHASAPSMHTGKEG